jgi:ribonuclease T2
MRISKKLSVFALITAFIGFGAVGIALPRQANFNAKSANSNFDFYVLALSWSPTYCLSDGANNRGGSQCRLGANYGFVVHGLWPQYEQGFPRSCPTDQSGPSSGLISGMQDIMPSRRLVEIAWQRHGTCSGLSAPIYFETLRRAYSKIKIPNAAQNQQSAGEIEASFVAQNQGLNRRQLAVTQNNGRISEVRICLTKSLEFRDCPEIDRRGVNDNQNLIIPARQ